MTTESLPPLLKSSMVFIDRVGFPAIAFLMMCYLCFSTLSKVSSAIEKNTEALNLLRKDIAVAFERIVK